MMLLVICLILGWYQLIWKWSTRIGGNDIYFGRSVLSSVPTMEFQTSHSWREYRHIRGIRVHYHQCIKALLQLCCDQLFFILIDLGLNLSIGCFFLNLSFLFLSRSFPAYPFFFLASIWMECFLSDDVVSLHWIWLNYSKRGPPTWPTSIRALCNFASHPHTNQLMWHDLWSLLNGDVWTCLMSDSWSVPHLTVEI